MNSLIGPTAAEQLAAEQLAKQHTTETLAKVTSVANLKRINEIDDATWCRTQVQDPVLDLCETGENRLRRVSLVNLSFWPLGSLVSDQARSWLLLDLKRKSLSQMRRDEPMHFRWTGHEKRLHNQFLQYLTGICRRQREHNPGLDIGHLLLAAPPTPMSLFAIDCLDLRIILEK